LDRRLLNNFQAAFLTAVARESRAIAKLAAFDPTGLSDEEIQLRRESYLRTVERETNLVNSIATEIVHSTDIAIRLINDERLNVFDFNYRGALTDISRLLGFRVDWTIYDRNQLRALLIKSDRAAPFTKIAFRNLGKNRTIVQRLQDQLTQAIVLGESVPKINRRVRDVATMTYKQAQRIARTEVMRVANEGRMLGYEQAQDDYNIPMKKQWISTLDDRTRRIPPDKADHVEMHMEQAELKEAFSNGLMQPGDSSGPPQEVINCRCTTVPILAISKGSKAYHEIRESISQRARFG